MILLFLFGMIAAAGEETKRDQTEASLRRAIFNFYAIEPGNLYRSGCPSAESYDALKRLGVRTVVNFIDRKDESRKEREELKSLGIDSISIPWNGFDHPKDEDVETFLAVLRDPSKKPLLIHCKRGAERTGLMIACWRIAEQGWTADQAYEEMKRHKFRRFWYGHLKQYVYDFAKRYGQTANSSISIWEKAKTAFLYALYRIRKLNPLAD